jgi:hypothetical protein
MIPAKKSAPLQKMTGPRCGALSGACNRGPRTVPRPGPRPQANTNSAQRMNEVTIRGASLPPSVDEFSEQCSGYLLLSLIDLFSGYDQCSLTEESRDLTAFHTPLGLMRMTTLL